MNIRKDSRKKRRARYLYLLKGTGLFYDVVRDCLNDGEKPYTVKRETVIRDVSLCVLAPAMNAYIMWMLKAAMKKKIRRLYFLARDGYFMYTTAKKLCEMLHLPIDCRYLSCSRYSVRIPMFHLNMQEALDYIVRGGIDVTLDKVFNRAGLSDTDKTDVINDLGGDVPRGVIPYAELPKLRRALEKSGVFTEAVKRRSREAFPAAAGYLEQEGLFEDISYAFADSGWTGSMQKVLGQLLEKCGEGRRLHGFYWGLYELPADADPLDYECFYFGPEFGVRRKIGFSNCLFESIFSAPHGMTLGYEQSWKKVSPVYAGIREANKAFNEQTGVYLEEFTVRLAERLRGLDRRALYRKMGELGDPEKVRPLLDTFMGEPSRYEAAVYGSLPFSDDVMDEKEQQVAVVMSQEELMTNHPLKKAMILAGISKERIRESAWFEGSAVRGGADADRHLRAYRMYKRLLYAKKEAQRIRRKILPK